MDQYKSPHEKSSCIEKLVGLISIVYKEFIKNEGPGADDIIPNLFYTFIKSKPKMIYSTSKYISMFTESENVPVLSGINEIMSFIEFIRNAKPKQMKDAQEKKDS